MTDTRDAPRYHITCLNDFLNVPPDRLLECVLEFAIAVFVWRKAREVGAGEPGNEFTWIDDGAGSVALTVTSRDGNHKRDVPLGDWHEGEWQIEDANYD